MVSQLACSLVATLQTITLTPGSLARRLYQQTQVTEQFSCNYGLNPRYRDALERSGLRMSGLDADGEVRLVELPSHPFYVATLFLPQMRSMPDQPHPLITAYLEATLACTSPQPSVLE